MSSRRTAARRRTAIATTLSLAGHAAIVALIALDLDRGADEPPLPPAVEMTLTPRIDRTQPRSSPRPTPARPTSPRPRRAALAGMIPSVPVSPLAAPAAPSPSPPAPPPAEDGPTALQTGCLGKRGLELEARVDCKLEIWSVLDRQPPRDLGDGIPADKKAAYAAAAERQAARRAPVSQMGNAKANDCPQSNLGAGCASEMVLPLFGKAF